jgi:class 3 adenylate cyclase
MSRRVSTMADEDLRRAAALERNLPARAEMFVPAQAANVRLALPFGVKALVFAIASMAICFGTASVEFILGIDTLGMNPHVQAVLMWGLSLIAVYALWQDRKCHHSSSPVALAAFATAILILTLYVRYFVEIEVFAYAILVIAAFLNQNIFLGILNRTVLRQAREIGALNQDLEAKVENQVHEIDRLARLKQFLSPQVADLVISEGKEKLLETHRCYIACLFCDIRDFTALSEDIEPEEVIAILQDYHERIGGLVTQHHGTIGYRAGDGLMAFFNDPIPCEAPVLDAVKLALDIRGAFEAIREPWSKRGYPIGLGLGIASGYATLGIIGFQGRSDYTAIGGVVNIASRLCDKATDGQILIAQRAFLDVEPYIQAYSLGTLELKGVKNALDVHNILGLGESLA